MYGVTFRSDATKASREKCWKELCNDKRWKHNEPTEETTFILFCGEEVTRAADDRWGERARWKAVPVPDGMHDGAVAPHFVWENTPTKLNEREETYLQRLICALDGRFVCLMAVEKQQDNKNGMPEFGERCRWRYWDNDGRVYQDHGIEWTTSHGRTLYSCQPTDPGEFGSQTLWMFDEGVMDYEFWDAVWRRKHEGSTGNPRWDEALNRLAKQAGITVHTLNEKRLDLLAKEKGWSKIDDVQQPDMASYRQDGQRINFYLTTGTVGTCLDHPTQNKTQLFRRGIDIEQAAVLLDNPREHTGRGYKRKATDDPLRRCAVCLADKPNNEFSKNQKRKGAKAKCTSCAQSSSR